VSVIQGREEKISLPFLNDEKIQIAEWAL